MDSALKPASDPSSPLPVPNAGTVASVYDPNAVADLINKKIDKIDAELEELKPRPPTKIQKLLRIAAYPITLATGWIFGRNELQEQTQTFMKEIGKFNNMKHPLIENTHSMAEHEAEKNVIIKTYLQMSEEKIHPKGFVKEMTSNLERDALSFTKRLSPYAKTRVAFATLFGTGAPITLLLTLSDNKNFLNFSKKHKHKQNDKNQGMLIDL